MGIEAEIKEVSSDILNKLKQYAKFIELFLNAKYLPSSLFWQNTKLDLNDPEDRKYYREFTHFAAETLLKLNRNNSTECDRLDRLFPKTTTNTVNFLVDIYHILACYYHKAAAREKAMFLYLT